ncbi:ribbon-helix-helix protein, CopG family [Arthrobacter sp. H5]|uniref:ribbon-helix-helix protein, CopG family n=1 Tax=Arthrobacter sp. H5 TaxID=1267973 RepID=UPI00048133FC|nr:ribbon-helix-helix protein, CopG family [Arthrobacter sp. H5]
MKTAISVPDEIYHQATRRARALGMSRSEFFARAADAYLHQLDARSITEQINEAIGQQTGIDDSLAAAVAGGRATLERNTDEW